MRHVDTFFRGYRRETIIDGCSFLRPGAGVRGLKLSMKIPLSGDQLVGMPSWVGEPFAAIAKPDFAGKFWASEMELNPMLLHVFALPQSEKEIMTIDNVRLTGFRIEHDNEDEHPNVILTFTAYLPRTGAKYLKFIDDNFGTSVFIRFDASQMELLDDNPNIHAIDARSTAVEDDGGDDEEDDNETGSSDGEEDIDQEEEEEEQVETEHTQPQPPAPVLTTRGRRKAPAAESVQ